MMTRQFRIFAFLSLLTGIIYPLIIFIFAQVFFADKAGGQLLKKEEKIIGSRLIAQRFEGAQYFHTRPSAVDYNPLPSGGSQLGPTSAALRELVLQRRSQWQKVGAGAVPVDLLFASGSGLDPHITLQAALFQTERIAKNRKVETSKIQSLVHSKASGLFTGYYYVNVIELNLALDALEK